MDEPTLFDEPESAPAVAATGDLHRAESLVALMELPGVGARRAIQLADGFRSWAALIDASPEERRAVARVDLQFVSRPKDIELPEQVRLVGYFDDEFPDVLRKIPNAPAALWVRGRLPDPVPRIAVVGSRSTTEWGASMAAAIASDAVQAGIAVVSGLALGIDIAAHRAAVRLGGDTIAVLGGGVDVPSPAAHRSDAEEIIEAGGALVSEQPLGTPPSARSLVSRNRLQAGLSGATVVVQCGQKSGTLTTAKFAKDQGRILAVPVPPESELAAPDNAGSLDLLRAPAWGTRKLVSRTDLAALLSEIHA